MDLTDEPTIKTSKREKTWTHQLRYFSSCSRTEGFWGIRDGCSWKLVSPSQPASLRLPLSSSWNQSWIPSKPRRLKCADQSTSEPEQNLTWLICGTQILFPPKNPPQSHHLLCQSHPDVWMLLSCMELFFCLCLTPWSHHPHWWWLVP